MHNDLQHTTMGIVWWCAGLLGVWLSRKRNGRPKRNIIPGIVIMLTGYAMSGHPQHSMISTMIHSFFGYTLMAAGLTRIIEIAFLLRDRSTLSVDGTNPNSFQYLPPFVRLRSLIVMCVITNDCLASVCFRIPFHGCNRRADAALGGRRNYPRLVHSDSVQHCVHSLPL